MRRIGVTLLAATGLAFALAQAGAQDKFPSKPVKILVPYAPGGATDIVARIVAEPMRQSLGQSFVVENKPGAFGILAIEEMARARPDGYTIQVGNVSTNAITPVIFTSKFKVNYDRDVAPVTNLIDVPAFLVVTTTNFAVKDVKELVDYAKKNPGKLNYGSAGTGSATHLNMELFRSMAGIDIVHIPYKGSTQARQDVLSGQVQLAMDGLLPLQPLIKDGRLKPIGITSSKRALSNPEIPTLGEVVKGYATDTWYGILVPAGTPRDVIARLHAAAVKALNAPATRDRFQKLGAETVANSPEDFRRMLEAEQKVWAKVVKDSGAKVE